MSNADVTLNGVEMLRRARERIATPEQWGKGRFAQDKEGNGRGSCASGWREDDCLCVDAAVMHADVLALLDEAIALAESMLTVPS